MGEVDTFRSHLISCRFDNLGFILRETCYYTHHTFLLGSPNERELHVSSTFSGAVAGKLEVLWIQHSLFRHHLSPGAGNIKPAARGVSHFQPLYFVIGLLSLLLLCVVCFLYQKSKKISYLLLKLSFEVCWHV